MNNNKIAKELLKLAKELKSSNVDILEWLDRASSVTKRQIDSSYPLPGLEIVSKGCSDALENAKRKGITDSLIENAPDLLKNLSGLLAWIEHAKKQPNERDHMPDNSYLKSAYDAVNNASK